MGFFLKVQSRLTTDVIAIRHFLGLIFTVFLAVSQNLSAQPLIVPGDEDLRISGDNFLMITHGAFYFDRGRYTEEGIQSAIQIAVENSIPIVTVAFNINITMNVMNANRSIFEFPLNPNLEQYFYDYLDVSDYIIKSATGANSLTIEAQNVLLAGSYFSQCFCESLKDVILNTSRLSEDLPRFYILMDSIAINNIQLSKDSSEHPGHQYLVQEYGEFSTRGPNLLEIYRNTSETDFLEIIRRDLLAAPNFEIFFGEPGSRDWRTLGSSMCMQKGGEELLTTTDEAEFLFRIHIDDRSTEFGPSDGTIVNLHFLSSMADYNME